MTLKHATFIKPLALVLAGGAVAAPAASARIDSNVPLHLPSSTTQLIASPPRTVTVVKSSGFEWADAGIGAGAVVALALTGLGATLTVTRRRQARPAATSVRISAT
jgi:hypothetical protein